MRQFIRAYDLIFWSEDLVQNVTLNLIGTLSFLGIGPPDWCDKKQIFFGRALRDIYILNLALAAEPSSSSSEES